MDVSLDKNDRPAEQVNPMMGISNAVRHALIWVNWFFTMTNIDRYKAGIDTSGEGRGDSY